LLLTVDGRYYENITMRYAIFKGVGVSLASEVQATDTTLSPTLSARLVRYADLRPCINAFIDARSPGSDKKENFTIIGPGVAENPNQHVHIAEPHGFNIGAARQPPNCTNSLHSHDSAEVFIVHTGQWRFFWGEDGKAGDVFLNPGDTISIPIHVFRGFENVGTTSGFMFAVLGGDDPGRVHWAPHVIERASGYGLVLLENGALIDTTLGETVPENAAVVHPATRQEIAYIRVPALAEMQACVAPHIALQLSAHAGVAESKIIDDQNQADGTVALIAPPKLPHGFTLSHMQFAQGAQTTSYKLHCTEVLLVHAGSLRWQNNTGEQLTLNAGDTFTVPRGMSRQLTANAPSEVFVVRGIDA
jgi:quercetin dioxygenase-like cupin family protein